ncbi:hypothetical protein AGMMS50229_21150 [Campylobacterota bacterium]|nr:hypothetical protein AGMMS50229_21150 [Campylobacterota bacterium]
MPRLTKLTDEEEIKLFTQMIALNPNAASYLNRGLSYAKSGDHTRAVADFTQAVRNCPVRTLCERPKLRF